MTTPDRIRVAIIGCGKIGTEWDRNTCSDGPALTHARAFRQNLRVDLVAVCDRDRERARSAAEYWRVALAYTDPQRLFSERAIDIAVIAVPSEERWAVIEPALAAGIKVLVIEKPLATTLAEARHLVAAVDASGVRAVVNYSRNWDPSMRDLKNRIFAGEMGQVQRVVATYGKGVGNNGSHLIDLTGFLCGASPVRARALGSPIDAGEADWTPTRDRTWDAQVEFMAPNGASINLTLLGTDHRAFTCFELQVIGEKAMFELLLGGRHLNWIKLQDDPNYAGYVVPAPAVELRPRYLEAMQEMADEAVRLALGDTSIAACDAHAALRTAVAVEAIQRSAQVDGQWISMDAFDFESD